ncbi:putative 5xTM membrane YitT family protein [Reinekea marinisedimentorum]|uniref:Putative 5xTM membrane YitT family protein n=2 Tax=Reinekea marinisedimentorum TaxID=230495 RepID=A0A4R3IBL5_9GAMM|nr:putative 5xTM membrane YitT family protein [Reinekea marinisedimentorum]
MKQMQRHSFFEDIIALFTACVFVSLGVYLFKMCGFLTGGTAGIALILTKLTMLSFGQAFFLVNLPFYYLAWTRMGKRFTLNTFVTVTVVSFVSDWLPAVITISSVNRVFAAIAAGLLVGMGILIMFRHVSSLGGLGVLGKYLQEREIMNAGRFMMAVDVCIVTVGYFLVPFDVLLLSILGAIALNVVIAINHKPGRYQIT